MVWIIQSQSEGPVIISDLNIVLHMRQSVDVDLVGREIAEKSNDLKLMLLKNFVKEIRKEPMPEVRPRGDDGPVFRLHEAAERVEQAARAIESRTPGGEQLAKVEGRTEELARRVEEQTKKVEEQTSVLREVVKDVKDKHEAVLAEVRAIFEKDPLGVKVIKEALENIVAERAVIAEKKVELRGSGMSDAEIAAHEKILNIKDRKLEKNSENLGKSVSKSATEVQDALDAFDEIGL